MDMNFFEAINGRKTFFPEAKVKNWMYQVILAVDHMHSKGVFHRDIKPENILLKDDVAKLADFGSVRGIGTPHPFTEYISTRWYRAPECMLTNGYYNQEIDIWGIGCVFFEMLTLVPLFPGEESDNKLNEIKQITKVFQNLGPPPISLVERWRKNGVLASVNLNFDFSLPRKTLAPKLKHVSRECVEFIEACLVYDPEARITAAQAKNHPYFRDLRDGEARRYRQISNIRTRERERESSYEGDSSAGSMNRGAGNVSVININIQEVDPNSNGRRGNKLVTKSRSILPVEIELRSEKPVPPNRRSQISDESDPEQIMTGGNELPPLPANSKVKGVTSVSKKPKKPMQLPPNDSSAGGLVPKASKHPVVAKIQDKKSSYVSPYSQKAIKGNQDIIKTNSGAMFRSKDMELVKLTLSSESAWDVINFLGRNESAMIVKSDHDDFQAAKSFIARNKMLEQWSQKMLNIEEKCEKYGVLFKPRAHEYERINQSLASKLNESGSQEKDQLDLYTQSVEERLKNLEDYFRNFDDFAQRMKDHDNTCAILRNLRLVLPGDMNPFTRGSADIAAIDETDKLLAKPTDSGASQRSERLADTRLMYYVGLIDTENVGKFQKMVFRITRGKVLVKASDIGSIPNIFDHLGDKYRSLNPTDNQKAKSKSLLFMFLIGKDSQLGKRLKAIISVFDVFHVSLPPNDQEINKMLADSAKAQDEMTKIARKTVDEIQTILEYFVQLQDVGISRLDELKYLINREKMIYKAMAYLEQQNDLYSLKVWIDKEEQQTILEQLMHYCSTKSNMTKPIITLLKENARNKPPSKFDLNEFTAPFQQIVETYAIPKYKEINPAPFTAGTFPFLFGVMFGDACHGLIIFCLGIYLLLRSDDFSKRGGVYAALNSLRYMIALLGFFSFYNGIVYNDFASIPLVLFESCYHYVPESTGEGGQKIHAHYLKKPDCTYPFGIDWTWYEAGNDIPFMNSYKMKVAIILGVLQMLFGIILKGFNAFYFKSALDFICEVIPQFLFLGGLFGYMCVLIVFKWLTEWGDKPPQIISVFTSLTKVDEKLNVLGNQDLQQQIQTVILVTCMVSTLLMFFPKPIILAMRSKGDHKLTQNERKISSGTPKHKGSVGSDGLQFDTQTEDQLILDADEEHDATGRHQHSSRDSHSSSSSAAGGHEHEGFGELMVHQAIETIEFVLGSISNTASYLRLWALSLAHSQLSKVFLNLLMHSAYENAGNSVVAGVTIAIKFVSLATTTAGILLMMDAMECFLHTLRLHWVEFQSKFYKGEGLKYEPFSFKEENK